MPAGFLRRKPAGFYPQSSLREENGFFRVLTLLFFHAIKDNRGTIFFDI
jgi:hypothetical protein